MGLDALSPVAPARIRCLLLPCGNIRRSRFLNFVERLQQVETVRLGDISPNGRPYRTMFSPLAFPTGLIIYDMLLSNPQASHLALVPFELYHEPLAIIAIADGRKGIDAEISKSKPQSQEDTDEARTQELEAEGNSFDELLGCVVDLKDQYPSALVHQVFIFDCDTSVSDLPASLIPIPSLEKSKTTTMRTLMCDMTSHLLAEMTSYAKSLQALPNIETPKRTQNERLSNEYHPTSSTQMNGNSRPGSRMSNTKGSRSSSPAGEVERLRHRASVAPQVSSVAPGSRSSIERSRSRSRSDGSRTPPVTFDEINGVSELQGAATNQEKTRHLSKDKVPVHGFGSGSLGERARNTARGRIGVVIGSMYLLAGRWPDAIKELVESATVARANSDHVWHGKALDYILVCLLMCAWVGMDFEIPQVCYPMADKLSPTASKSSKHTPSNSMPDLSSSGTASASNRLVSLQNLCQLLPDLVNNILHLYVRAATFTTDQLPQVVFSESTIRFAKLLAIIQASHGTLDYYGLQSVVLNKVDQHSSDSVPSKLSNFPTKSEIAAVLLRAFPSPASERSLDISDKVNILAGIAAVLAKLGYHRKKAFILRELMSDILPALVQSRKDNAAELGVHPAASISAFDLDSAGTGLEEILGPQSRSENGTRGFLMLVCEIYGVVISSLPAPQNIRDFSEAEKPSQSSGALDTADAIEFRALNNANLRSFGNSSLKFDVLRTSINICEALPDFRGVLRFSGDLLRTAGSGIVPASDSSDGSPTISIEDQMRLSQNFSRTISAVRQFGLDHVDAEYWDDFLVRKIEIVNSTAAGALTPHDEAHLEVAGKIAAEKEKNPFIYNPFKNKSSTATAEAMLIAHEEANFTVIVQNLYDFDIEIEWIKLDTSDVLFDTMLRGLVIGPYRTQTMQLFGVPNSPGSLEVTGCIAKIKGCRERRFPIFDAPWKDRQDGKIKRLGLAAASIDKTRPISVVSDPGRVQKGSTPKGPIASSLIVKVIEPQPNIVVKAISLPQSAIMLLAGEVTTFTVTLQNTSSMVPADLLLLTFTDSTLTALQSALTKKNLSPADLYEAELSSSRKEAFRWRRQNKDLELFIAPNKDLILEIDVLGKHGLTDGTIQIDYGYIGIPKADVKDKFYTRQIVIPLTVTINNSVSLAWNDFLPFTGDFAWHNQQLQQRPTNSTESTPRDNSPRTASRQSTKSENRFQALLQRLGLGAHGDDHCLLLLDFRNSWPSPLSISLQVRESLSKVQNPCDPWRRAYTAHEVLQPDQTSRLMLLLPRISLQNPHAPIPSLNPANKRQYIVSASNVSPDIERANREAFWFREEILKHIRASWEEDTTGRKGDIDLRTLNLTPRMIDAIKLEDVAITISLSSSSSPSSLPQQNPNTEPSSSPTPSESVTQTARSHFQTTTDTFLTLKVQIQNRSPHPLTLLLRLQPKLRHQPYNIALDLAKKFAFNGLLQRTLPLVAPRETTQLEIGVCFLCSGEFEIGACVEEARVLKDWDRDRGDGKEELGDGEQILRVRQRRSWGGREACVVVVNDEDEDEDEDGES